MTAPITDVPVEQANGAPTTSGGDDRLASATAKLRTRGSLPLDKWFQLIGAVLMGIGVIAILGGWYGVSHTAREWRQTPYLVSGGLLGLGLIFIGGFSYFAYWLTRLVEQSQRQTAVLERIERALGGGAGEASADGVGIVVVGHEVHRIDCPLIARRSDARPYAAGDVGLTPCRMCEPELPASVSS